MKQLSLDLRPPKRSLPRLWTPDDIYNSCDDETLKGFGEDHRVERKRVQVASPDLAVYLSVWANTQPHGGIIFVGVGNDGTLLGCKSASTQHLNDLRAIGNLCPDARFEIKEVPITNDKGESDFVLAFRAYYRSDRLVQLQNGDAYIREGEEKRRL